MGVMKKNNILGGVMVAAVLVGTSACALPAEPVKRGPNSGAADTRTPSVEEVEGLSAGTGTASDHEASAPPAAEPVVKTQAEELKDCIAKSGTGPEKKAAKKITKVQGIDTDSLINMADIYTSLTGDMFSSDGNTGNLIASAFASCYKTDDGAGLVTVHNENGELIATGNY